MRPFYSAHIAHGISRYSDIERAIDDAKGRAWQSPGDTFYVLKAVGSVGPHSGEYVPFEDEEIRLDTSAQT